MIDWKEKLKGTLIITTGDGSPWQVLYNKSSKSVKFNAEGFNFINVDGTYVQRERHEGGKYPLEFYIDTDQQPRFEEATHNRNPWSVDHPFFGTISCHPVGSINYEVLANITRVTCTVWETIEKKFPKKDDSSIKELIANVKWTGEFNIEPSTALQRFSEGVISVFQDGFELLPSVNTNVVELKNRVREASAAVNGVFESSTRWLRSMQSLIDFPAVILADTANAADRFTVEVYNTSSKINSILSQMKKSMVDMASEPDMQSFEPLASYTMLSSLQYSLDGNFNKSSEVVAAVNILTEMYDIYNDVYEANPDYTPNPEIAQQLDYFFSVSIDYIYQKSLTTSQERSIILEKDSNPILLTHRFYGFNDENFLRFIYENDLSLNELLRIKKGRKIIWYV